MSEDELNEQLEAEFVCTFDALDDYMTHHERLRGHLKEVRPCTWFLCCPSPQECTMPSHVQQVAAAVAGVPLFGEGSL